MTLASLGASILDAPVCYASFKDERSGYVSIN